MVAEQISAWAPIGQIDWDHGAGLRVTTLGRYRFEANAIVFEFEYKKVGKPIAIRATLAAALRAEGAEVEQGPRAWSLGADGPQRVRIVLRTKPGLVRVDYVQRYEAPRWTPSESRDRHCFVAGEDRVRVARSSECKL